eukprot:GFUD01028571.1.p1 GENE.GFUD01028571.1~~GFUD01028571.1.p1  ORF type:complete len:567 (-),score=207.89 GFUD01028571.1:217-1917(-)
MYGTCIHLRLMSEDLKRSVLQLLGRHKTVSRQGGGIDLPGGQMSSHLARLAVPTEADLAMGNIQWTEVDDVFGEVDFRAREADITMREFNQAGLEYEGLELPLLSTRDILTESWSLIDEELHGGLEVGASQDGAQPRRGILPDIFVLPSSKRARLEVEDPFDQEHTVMETVEQLGGGDLPTEETFMEQSEGDQATAAPVRSRMPTVPTIEVTQAVEEGRTTPNVEAVAGEEIVPLPPSPPSGTEDLPPPNLPSPEAAEAQLDLQPLVPQRKPKPAKKRRGLVWVDLDTQISSDSIRQGMGDFKDTMRCREVSMDFARQLPKVDFTRPGRQLGVALGAEYKEVFRRAVGGREVTWDWQEEDGRERQTGVGEGSVEASGEGSRMEERNLSGSFVVPPQFESSRIGVEQEEMADRRLPDVREEEEDSRADNLPTAPDLDKTAAIQDQQEEMQVDKVINEQVMGDMEPDQPEDIANNLQDMELGVDIDQLMVPRSPPTTTITQSAVHAKVSQLVEDSGWCSFSSLCPPTSTSRGEAAITFFHLLQLEKEGKVMTSQEEAYGEIEVRLNGE